MYVACSVATHAQACGFHTVDFYHEQRFDLGLLGLLSVAAAYCSPLKSVSKLPPQVQATSHWLCLFSVQKMVRWGSTLVFLSILTYPTMAALYQHPSSSRSSTLSRQTAQSSPNHPSASKERQSRPHSHLQHQENIVLRRACSDLCASCALLANINTGSINLCLFHPGIFHTFSGHGVVSLTAYFFFHRPDRGRRI